MQRLLSKEEVAEQLHISPRTVDRLRTSGELRSVQIRSRVLFDPEDVQHFLKKSRYQPQGDNHVRL